MSTTSCGLPTEQNKISTLNTTETPLHSIEGRFFHVEIESGSGILRTHMAANTSWVFSVVTAMLANTLGLRTIPMTPTQRQHPYHTPFGIRYLRDYVDMRIRAPCSGIHQFVLIHVGVLGSEEVEREEHLFIGTNFWRKVARRRSEIESESTVARELLEPDKHVSNLSPESPVEPVERRDSTATPMPPLITTTGTAPCGCPRPICTLADEIGPDSGTDAERLGTGRRSRPSRSTTRLEATSLFTHNHASTPPSSAIELEEESAFSHNATSLRDDLPGKSAQTVNEAPEYLPERNSHSPGTCE